MRDSKKDRDEDARRIYTKIHRENGQIKRRNYQYNCN